MTPRSPDFITDFDNEASREPLRNIYTADGSQLLSVANNGNKEEGSSYFTFRHDLQKMVQERLLDGGNEINSDNPKTITDFLKVALASCVANNSNEFMLAFSSHGAGYGGFGGDDNTRRRLTTSNANVKGAIQAALSSVAGAPSKLDVLGFDACLMQGFGAIDDYHSITKYYLASEAVEPGHGTCETRFGLHCIVWLVSRYLLTVWRRRYCFISHAFSFVPSPNFFPRNHRMALQ